SSGSFRIIHIAVCSTAPYKCFITTTGCSWRRCCLPHATDTRFMVRISLTVVSLLSFITNVPSEDDKCSGHGTFVNNRCVCEHGYKGDICQYRTNCHHDEDCLNGGKCVEEPNSIAAASCYCSYGFFGKNCEQKFISGYEYGDDNCFSYSTINEKSYAMYGMFDPNCYNKEKLSDNDFVYFRKGDVEVIMDYASSSWISLGWRPEGLDKSCRLFPDLEGELFADVAQEGPRPVMPRNNGLREEPLRAPLHAMDCIDVVIGAVRDGRTRVQDSYSRDRSTPLEDFWYEGEMSLVAVAGRELDGRTIVMFRRPIQEIEPTDHPLGPGRMFVVWAKGQQQDAYAHGAPSALERSNSKAPFYTDDILKYHGSDFVMSPQINTLGEVWVKRIPSLMVNNDPLDLFGISLPFRYEHIIFQKYEAYVPPGFTL
ncbi:unnamed protein product, partial [Heligmosomoides polygyrus]